MAGYERWETTREEVVFSSDVKIKRLNEYAKIPTRGSKYAAGYDLYVAKHESLAVVIPPHQTVKIGTGIAVAVPKCCFGAIFARSGIATKKGLRPANAVGIVDADYTGEIIVALHNDTDENQVVYGGERIAQLVIIPYIAPEFHEMNDLEETLRGAGGFGSTDGIKIQA